LVNKENEIDKRENMAGNNGHPFFGNQYVISDYAGGYQYDYFPNQNIKQISNKTDSVLSLNNNIISNTMKSDQPSKTILNISKNETKNIKVIILGVVVFISLVGIGVYIRKKFKAKKNLMDKNEIDLEKIGSCIKCGNHLNSDLFISENDSESKEAYIICSNCGEFNYAWYSEDKRDDIQIETSKGA
jgi:DNA-directed RNA polymerase subunit RPC12/RpoP